MTAPTPRRGSLPDAPVLQRDGWWWMFSKAGSIPVRDPAFTAVLDNFAQAMAAADRAVAHLRTRQTEPPACDTEDRR
ncbi:hypothetical protein [Streptomyces sp. NPDC059575]|uniref:hypothetical protein n=1 Tax=Streptomyces sp. NPDC059575 TaxID=3346872 RepID=UPI0036ADA0DE